MSKFVFPCVVNSRNVFEQGDGGVSLLKQSERQVKTSKNKINTC